MAIITHVKNPFDPINSRVLELRDGGLPLFRYFGAISDEYEVIASVNGRSTEDFEYIVAQNDSVAFVAIPRGGDDNGKTILRIVAMAVVSYYAGPAAGAIFGEGTTAAAIAAGVFVAVGGMVVNALIPLPNPDFNNPSGQGYAQSSTYGWGESYNALEEGGTIPLVYGTARIVPPVISQYVETVGNKQYLNILYAVNDGEVTSISDIEINNNPVSFYSGIQIDTRLGTNTQTVIGNFDNTRVDVGVSAKLGTPYTTRQTSSNVVDQLDVIISAPNGLYEALDSGILNTVTVELSVQYRKVGDTLWTDFAASPTISGAKASTIRVTFSAEDLAPGQYEIRAARLSPENTTTRRMETVYFDAFTEVVYDDFTYPNTALLSVRALATDQLSGAHPRVSCLVTANSNNPSLIVQDILTNVQYGAAVDPSNVNTVRFDEWETFCTDNSITANIVFDSSMAVRDAINTVSQIGRALIVQAGAEFLPIVDKVENLATQKFLFTMGNIVRDSFQEEYLPIEDRATVMEITYFDENLGYERQSIELWQDGFDDSEQDLVRSAITLYGCTSRDVAIKHGRYLLNRNRYLTSTVSFEADVDSVACQIGDVIDVAHDVPQWGYSGRIIQAEAQSDPSTWVYETDVYVDGVYVDDSVYNLVKIDREVTLEAGVEYLITVKFNSDDSRETASVVSATTVTTDLIPTPIGFSKPLEDYMLYSIGVYDPNLPVYVANHSKLFRVLSLTRSGDQRRKITAIEYVPEVYDDAIDSIPVVNTSSLSEVSNLFGSFSWKPTLNDTGGSIVNLDWTGQALSWDVWYRKTTDTEYTLAGTTTSSEFRIEGLSAAVYEFKVGSETVEVEVLGLPVAPSEPSNVTATLQGTQIFLEWTRSPYEGQESYSIRLNGTVIQDGYKGTELAYTKALTNGTYQFSVASINSYNQLSAYVDANPITIQAVPSITNVVPYAKATAVQFYVDFTMFSEFNYIQVYESLDNVYTNAYELFKKTEANFIRDGLPLVSTRYYWFELVDIYGNHGALFGPVQGQTETDPANLMLTLKEQQGTGQYLPALSDILLTGYVNGEQVVGVDGSLVVDGSIVADKLGVNELSAITANIGTITAGYIQNVAGDAFVNLDAALGTDTFLQISTDNWFTKNGAFQLGGAQGITYDGSNVTFGTNATLSAERIQGDTIWTDGSLVANTYAWNSGSPTGFGLWTSGDPDSGQGYNIIGGSIYGGTLSGVDGTFTGELTSSKLGNTNVGIKDHTGEYISPLFFGYRTFVVGQSTTDPTDIVLTQKTRSGANVRILWDLTVLYDTSATYLYYSADGGATWVLITSRSTIGTGSGKFIIENVTMASGVNQLWFRLKKTNPIAAAEATLDIIGSNFG